MAAVPEQSLPQANEIAQRASVDEWAGRWLSPARFGVIGQKVCKP